MLGDAEEGRRPGAWVVVTPVVGRCGGRLVAAASDAAGVKPGKSFGRGRFGGAVRVVAAASNAAREGAEAADGAVVGGALPGARRSCAGLIAHYLQSWLRLGWAQQGGQDRMIMLPLLREDLKTPPTCP